MVKHIVLYNFKEGVNHEEAIRIIRDALTPLVGQIPGLRHLEVCLTFQGMDYALYSEFDSREAMENYEGEVFSLYRYPDCRRLSAVR